MQVNWNKCTGNVWCKLYEVNLSHSHFDNMTGIYVIWHGGTNPQTVRVGQGSIKDRIEAHRRNPQIQAYQYLTLYVTWGSIPTNSLDGVEAYLAKTLKPLVGEQFPNVPLIQVNLPWS